MSSPASAALPTVRLVPLTGPVPELLQSGFLHRPVLVLDGSRDESMIIGRGSRTGIRDPSVMRKIFRLSWDDDGNSNCTNTHQQVSAIRIAQDTSKIFINGLPWEESQPKVHLGHGDTLSLNCENYGYKVEIISSVGSAGGSAEKKRKTVLPASGSEDQDEDVVKAVASSSISIPAAGATSLSEEIQCSVCLEIQVNSRAAVPCGHSSCGSCISKLQQCPQCRARIKSHVPNVQLESLISTLASVPNLLDADDVEHYNGRKSVNPTTDNKTVRLTSFYERSAVY